MGAQAGERGGVERDVTLDAQVAALDVAEHGVVIQRRAVGCYSPHAVGIGPLVPLCVGGAVLIGDLVIGRTTVGSTRANGLLVRSDGHDPVVLRQAGVDVVRNGVELAGRGNSVRVAVGAATHREVGQALVHLDLVVSGTGLALGNVREIDAVLRVGRARRARAVVDQARVRSVEVLVVVPELLAGVLGGVVIGVDLFAVGDLAAVFVRLSERVRCRRRAVLGIGIALEQARAGKDGVGAVTRTKRRNRNVDKRGRDLIGILAAQVAKEGGRGSGAARIVARGDAIHVKRGVRAQVARHERGQGRAAGNAVHRKPIERQISDVQRSNRLAGRSARHRAAEKRARGSGRHIHAHGALKGHTAHGIRSRRRAAAKVAQQTGMHVHVLGRRAGNLVTGFLGLDRAVAERDSRVLDGNALPRHVHRVVAVPGHVQGAGDGGASYICVANGKLRREVVIGIARNAPQQKLVGRVDLAVGRGRGGSHGPVEVVIVP